MEGRKELSAVEKACKKTTSICADISGVIFLYYCPE